MLLLLLKPNEAFEPVTIGIGSILLGGAGTYFRDYIQDQTYCRWKECCNDRYLLDVSKSMTTVNETMNSFLILFLTALRNTIQQELFGQHIAVDIISQAVIAHTAKVNSNISKKPLVISLHGTPGTGKNFVCEILIKAMYKEGLKSQYVHRFLGRSDFPLQSKVNEYKVSQISFKAMRLQYTYGFEVFNSTTLSKFPRLLTKEFALFFYIVIL